MRHHSSTCMSFSHFQLLRFKRKSNTIARSLRQRSLSDPKAFYSFKRSNSQSWTTEQQHAHIHTQAKTAKLGFGGVFFFFFAGGMGGTATLYRLCTKDASLSLRPRNLGRDCPTLAGAAHCPRTPRSSSPSSYGASQKHALAFLRFTAAQQSDLVVPRGDTATFATMSCEIIS